MDQQEQKPKFKSDVEQEAEKAFEAPPVRPQEVDFEPPLLTCLSLIATLHQRPITPQALKSGLPNADTNFTPSLCVRAAQRAHMSAKVVARKNVKSISMLVLPCILLLKNGNACILMRFDKNKKNVEIMVPEAGGNIVRTSLEKLQSEYTGYALFVKPEAKFDDRASSIKLSENKDWFWGTLKKFWPVYNHVILASLLINLFAIAGPLFVMNVYDRVVPNNAIETLWVLAIGVTLVYVFEFVLKNLRGYFVDVAGKNADVIITSDLLQHILGMRFDQMPKSTGSLANNLKEFEGMRDFFTSGTVTLLVDVPFLFLFLGIIYLVAGPVAAVPLIAIPIVIMVGLALQIPMQRAIEKTHAEATQKYSMLIEAINGLETIKTNSAESRIQGEWERIVKLTSESSGTSRTISTLATSFAAFMTQLVTVLVIIYGVYRIADGEMTMGALIAATLLSGRALAPLAAIAGLLTRYQQTKISLKALDDLMKKPVERPAHQNFLHIPKIQGQIQFRDVSFTYPNSDQPALSDVSFMIRAGERVAILGRVGSGKSTLGRLLTGLYRAEKGSIILDGTDIGQIDPTDLRRNIGYVGQDNYLFYGTVRDNISFGMPHADEATVKRAAKLAGVTDFLRYTRLGFDLQVGERGTSLSGGQRQAVAIARALAYDPPILLLDEPTSDMDMASEQALIGRMTHNLQGKTVILITHRLSVLALVDRIIVMDNGKVIADGPKDEIFSKLSQGEIQPPAPPAPKGS